MDFNFKKGDRVIYIPHHAKGDKNHPDCQHGVVKHTINEQPYDFPSTIWVLYDNKNYGKMITGDEPYTAQGTDKRQLIPEDSNIVDCYVCNYKFDVEKLGLVTCPYCNHNIVV